MTAHNPNAYPNPMRAAVYAQSQSLASTATRLNDSTTTASGASPNFTSSDGAATQCHLSTDASSAHSPRQLLISPGVGPNSANNADPHAYLYSQNFTLPSSQHQFVTASALNQSSMLHVGWPWMTGGNSSMLLSTNDAASQQTVNYSQNLYLQQSQPQQNSNIYPTNVNLSYMNGAF